MEFTKSHDVAELNDEMIGSSVHLCGWIEDLREMGKMTFATLRDASGRCQIIAKGDASGQLDGITRQSVVRVSGTVQETRAQDFDLEVAAEGRSRCCPRLCTRCP